MILAGDVGGTKTQVALFRRSGAKLRLVAHRSVRSRRYPGLGAIVKEFLTRARVRPVRACFGVAGPVLNDRSQATNLPWVIDARTLTRTLGLRAVSLINDLEAMAYGALTLPPSAFAVLKRGAAQPHGAIAVIAAGTGLGEAALIWDGRRYRAVPSEGGHADFAPRNELEVALLRSLAKRFGHVSYERILSGPGKVAIYRFLKTSGRGTESARVAAQLAAEDDPSPLISELALSGRSALCAKTLDLFVSIYGAEAGNVALKVLARGGVYIGGGIAPSILPKLKSGAFIRAFTDKGRLKPLLSRIPVRVILEEKAALYGAAHYALL